MRLKKRLAEEFRDQLAFGVPTNADEAGLRLAGQLRAGRLVVKLCKPIIDEIDHVLGRHYGFTEEELDFTVNYDIKYRMGGEAEDVED